MYNKINLGVVSFWVTQELIANYEGRFTIDGGNLELITQCVGAAPHKGGLMRGLLNNLQSIRNIFNLRVFIPNTVV